MNSLPALVWVCHVTEEYSHKRCSLVFEAFTDMLINVPLKFVSLLQLFLILFGLSVNYQGWVQTGYYFLITLGAKKEV